MTIINHRLYHYYHHHFRLAYHLLPSNFPFALLSIYCDKTPRNKNKVHYRAFDCRNRNNSFENMVAQNCIYMTPFLILLQERKNNYQKWQLTEILSLGPTDHIIHIITSFHQHQLMEINYLLIIYFHKIPGFSVFQGS